MTVKVVSLVNYSLVLANPAYTLKPFESKLFTGLTAVTADLASKHALKQLQAEVLTPIQQDDGSGQYDAAQDSSNSWLKTRVSTTLSSSVFNHIGV